MKLEDIHYTQGTDTYLQEGQLMSTVAIAPSQRKQFFIEHADVLPLLLREKENPLIEEGSIIEGQRDHNGEHYLTYEALTLLIEKKIRRPRKSASGLNYNIKNIFVLQNDFNQLKNILFSLDLLDGHDAKIIYIQKIHAIPIYLRNVNGVIHCFIVDSEGNLYGPPEELLTAIQSVFPAAKYYLSSTILQKDFYSCSTFAYKALLYFVKHGEEVFPWLEQYSMLNEELYYLPENKLMPRLLKMAQTKSAISDELLNTIVSNSPKMTLAEYYQKYKITLNGKKVNSAAILKKYKYLTIINRYLVSILENEKISALGHEELPRALQGRHLHYSQAYKRAIKATKINPIDTYLEIIDFFDNPTHSSLSAISLETVAIIQKRFPSFQTSYKNQFKKLENVPKTAIRKLFFIAGCAEIRDFGHQSLYSEFAKKLEKLFDDDYSQVVQFLKKHITFDTRQPVHDLCIFTPPRSHNWNQRYWAKLVMDFGKQATKYLALAPQIDVMLDSANTAPATTYNNELEKIKNLLDHYRYQRANEHEELNDLCRRHVLSEKDFELCLDIVNSKLKKFDLLPDFTILGRDLDLKLRNYRMIKLPIHDLRGLFLGEYSGCCQSIGKAGQKCAIQGMTSETSGFYVVLDEANQIVAQSWAWISTRQQLVFDSWEFSQSRRAFLFKPFISKAAEIILAHGFSQVLVGSGGRTPDVGFDKIKVPAKHSIKGMYSDAGEQYLIQENSTHPKDRFTRYCNLVSLDTIKFNPLFENMNIHFLQQRVLQFIQEKQVSFDELLALIRFFYLHKKYFLHYTSPIGLDLLMQICQSFPEHLDLFFNFKDFRQLLLIESIICYQDIELIKLVLNLLNPFQRIALLSSSRENIDRLSHLAATQNAPKVYRFLYEHHFSGLSWEEYVSLPNAEGLSALYTAAKNQKFEWVVDIAEHFEDKEKLTTLLNKSPKPTEFTAFHYLVLGNRLPLLKKMARLLGGKSVCTLLDNHITVSEYPLKTVPIVYFALKKQAIDTAKYLFDKFYEDEPRKNILAISDESLSLIGYAAAKNNYKLLQYLRSVQASEEQWIEQLKIKNGYNRLNALCFALHYKSWSCALFILRNLKTFEQIHMLLTYATSKSDSGIEKLHSKPNKILKRIIKRILSVYSTERRDYSLIVCDDSRSLIKAVISQQDVALFELFLKTIVSDQALLNELINDEKSGDTILECILDEFDYKAPWYNEKPITFSVTKKFIDCLFRYCTPDQIKLQLSCSSYLYLTCNQTLRYLLSIITNIDNGAFCKHWLRLGKHSPIEKVFHHQFHTDNLTTVMLDFAVHYHGLYAIQHYVMNEVKPFYHPITSFGNHVLLQFIFPIIRSNPKKLQILLDEMIHCFRQSSFRVSSFIWLLNQDEISTTMLKECISKEKRHAAFGNFAPEKNLKFMTMMWRVYSQRLSVAEQFEIIEEHIFDFLELISYRAEKFDERALTKLRPSITQLQEWLLPLKKQNKLLDVLTATAQDGKSFFNKAFASNSAALVKGILLVCDKKQREELILTVPPQEKKPNQRAIDTAKILTQCERIEHLMQLKYQINHFRWTEARNSVFFPSQAKDMASLRIHLKDINHAHCLFMEEGELNSVWNKVGL